MGLAARNTATTRCSCSSGARSRRPSSATGSSRTSRPASTSARLRALYFERLAPNAAMIEFIRELRERGLRTALLTNNVREWEPLWRAKLPELDELFELVVDSAFVGCASPTRRSTSSRSSGSAACARRGLRVRGRPRGELRGGAGARHGRGALRELRAGDPGDRVSAERSRSAVSVARTAARERSSLRRWCARSASQAVQADVATSAAQQHALAPAARPSRARAGTPARPRRAFCLRVFWSQPATTSTRARAAAPRAARGVTVSSRRARCWATKASIRSGSGKRRVDRLQRRHDALVLLHARRPRRAPRGRRSAGRRERSETPARTAIRSAVGCSCPSYSSASRASTSA